MLGHYAMLSPDASGRKAVRAGLGVGPNKRSNRSSTTRQARGLHGLGLTRRGSLRYGHAAFREPSRRR